MAVHVSVSVSVFGLFNHHSNKVITTNFMTVHVIKHNKTNFLSELLRMLSIVMLDALIWLVNFGMVYPSL